MQRSTLKKLGKRILQIGLPLLILVLFVNQVQKNWQDLTSHSFQWNPWLLALAFLARMRVKLKAAATAMTASGKKGPPEPDLWSISARMKSAISSAACNSAPA